LFFVIDLWNWIGFKLNIMMNLSSIDVLLLNVPSHCSSQIREIYIADVIHTLHAIWLSRNTLRFYLNKASLHAAKVRVHSLIGMSGNLSVGKSVTSYSSLVDSFSVSYHHRQIREVLSVKWKTPSTPWLKVNTDGSVIGINDACGGLFRDHLGSFLGAFTCNLGTCSLFTAKVHAFILALEYAAHHG